MVRILADQYKLSQVVRNLVSNALKFTSKPGTVKVSVDVISADSNEVARMLADIKGMAKSSFYLRISVTDSGCGISKENQAQLFGGIIQFNPGELQQGKGTGLGMRKHRASQGADACHFNDQRAGSTGTASASRAL